MFSFNTVLALVSVVPAFVYAATSSCTRSYTVKAGDYCDLISAANKASTWQMAVLNSDAVKNDCNSLQPGQNLCIGSQGQDCQTVHVVQAGDTCSAVVAKAGINMTMFISNNPQINADCTNMYIGEVMCVANFANAPPIPSFGMPTITPPSPAQAAPTAIQNVAPPPPSVTPAATSSAADEEESDLPFCDDGDDGDDEGDEPSVAQPAPSAIANAAPPPPSVKPASITPTAVAMPTPSKTPTPVSSAADEDESDLPFCDEL